MSKDYQGLSRREGVSNNVKSICEKYADIKNLKYPKSK